MPALDKRVSVKAYCNFTVPRDEDLADDWDVRTGRVRRRVALLLRSSERQPASPHFVGNSPTPINIWVTLPVFGGDVPVKSSKFSSKVWWRGGNISVEVLGEEITSEISKSNRGDLEFFRK